MGKKRRQLPWNWRDRLEIVFHEGGKEYEFIIQFKDGEELKGFEKVVGSLSVEKENPYFVSVAEVEEYFRGRGQGKKLYLFAINKLGKLSTKYHEASTLAQNLWKGLVKSFNNETDFWEGRLTVYHKEGVDGQND